jgi:hypothetical protein
VSSLVNDTRTPTRPEVESCVAEVRARLGDPAAYAVELRAAAGLVRSLFVYDTQGRLIPAQVRQRRPARRTPRGRGHRPRRGADRRLRLVQRDHPALHRLPARAQREQRRGTCLDEPGGRDGAIATPEPPFARR